MAYYIYMYKFYSSVYHSVILICTSKASLFEALNMPTNEIMLFFTIKSIYQGKFKNAKSASYAK